MMKNLSLLAVLAAACVLSSCRGGGRTDLFNGRDLTGWVCVTDDGGADSLAFRAANGVIRIAGSPYGYLRTEESYGDYRLHVEWRWIGEATNSGIFQRVQSGDGLWPEAVECQLQAGRAGDLLALGGAPIAGAEPKGRIAVKKRVDGAFEKDAGEWNVAEITCRGDRISVRVNGVEVNQCSGVRPRGHIALQSEGGPVEFRNIYLTRPE